jgi:hypothetical protein
MNMARRLLLAAGTVAVLVFAGIAGSAAFATTGLIRPNAAASPGPAQGQGTFKSNETATHESTESASREAAENSGQRPGPGGCHPNENSSHETTESAAREAAETAGKCPAPGSPGATATP